MFRKTIILAGLLLTANAQAQDTVVSIAEGERISRIGGCHDCHSVGFAETGGTIDPATALKGTPVGYQGPWGTTYAANLRLTAAAHTEDQWVDYLKKLETRPPMPWFNVHYFTEGEMRSLHQYIVSLGDPGDPAPPYAPPGEAPQTPFLVFVPQNLPS
ncbi:cytochrome C [Devosia beringensis]|uniref:cytochrome C n=1 Tax=Devosia beringensis TaxID=2657486 RepID=UPI00186B884F|nr:cytochrome C [Devosia beringensis]